MENVTYNSLIAMIKLFKKVEVPFPHNGKQNFHELHGKNNEKEEFELLINRKGHLREDVLTYQMKSKESGLLIRLDMTGPSHDGKDGNPIDTPHVHIFNETYNNGKWAIPFSDLVNTPLIDIMYDSLYSFLLYNEVDTRNVQIGII